MFTTTNLHRLIQSRYVCDFINHHIQADLYSFIHILTSGRFRSQKDLNNKILSHTSKIGKNYHIGLFTIIKCHSSLIY
jgi:hypothetical protein